MDFQKNLSTHNITTSDMYYRRQLNFISFNVHVLSKNTSVFYKYDESVAKKGADDVCSMLEHSFDKLLSSTVRRLVVFVIPAPVKIKIIRFSTRTVLIV